MVPVVKTDCNRIEALIGEVSARFVGSIDAHSASVPCWMRCDDKGSSRKPGLSGGRSDRYAKGIPSLSALVKVSLNKEPLSWDVFVFHGRRGGRQGDQIKVQWFSGDGINLYSKRLERGRFVWPSTEDGAMFLTLAQFSMLLEAIDWRAPQRTWWPTVKMA